MPRGDTTTASSALHGDRAGLFVVSRSAKPFSEREEVKSPMAEIKAIETKYKGRRFRSRLEARWAVFLDFLKVEWAYEKEGFDLGDAGYYLPDFWLPRERVWLEIKGDEPSDSEYQKVYAFNSALFEGHFNNRTPKETVLMAIGDIGKEHWQLAGDFWMPKNIGDTSLRALKVIADPTESPWASLSRIVCPVCGHENVHFGEPKYAPEREASEWMKPKYANSPWPGRGHHFTLAMSCEDGCRWDLVFGFHKGYTFAGIKNAMVHVNPAMHFAKNDSARLAAAYSAALSARFEFGDSGFAR